jgi:RNA recognition motif-containing protein
MLLVCPPAGFFSQFGRLLRVRMSRSKKTAKAKHYAFLEFQHADVAQIAAVTMDGYFLFKQVGSAGAAGLGVQAGFSLQVQWRARQLM